jgi:hypothetical protein
MRRITIIGPTALLLLLAVTAPAYARQDQQENKGKQDQQAKPEKQQQDKSARPERQQQAKGQQQQHVQQQNQNRQQQQQHVQQQNQNKQQQQQHVQQQNQNKQQQQQHVQQQDQNRQQQRAQQQNQNGQQAREQQGQQRQQYAQRTPDEERRQRAEPALRLSARSEGRIPDDRFRSNFGREHEFRIGSPRLVGGYSRFQYGGYWFGFVEPWPADWYYTDDVYVDYIDGEYYLCNPSYPGTRISINVVL